MYFFILFYGLFFVGIGFFMEKYPDTISGYSTMPAWRKKWIDQKGMARYMKKIMIRTGIIVVPVFCILWFLGLERAARLSLPVVPFISGIFALFGVRKFDRYKKK